MSGCAPASRAHPIYEPSLSRPLVHRHGTTSSFRLASPRNADQHDIGAIGRPSPAAPREPLAPGHGEQGDDRNGDENRRDPLQLDSWPAPQERPPAGAGGYIAAD